jgi:hypothetical protein
VVCNKSTYEVLHREREKIRKRAVREGRCVIPWKKIWYCNGQCDGCPYQKNTEVSLNKSVGNSGKLTLADVLTDNQAQESVFIEKIHAQNILARLDEIMPQAREIGYLRIKGMSDREIAKRLGISRTSMYRLLAKVQEELLKEFEEI